MAIKKICEKFILIIITISILLSFMSIPVANAALDLGDGDFYYSGTTQGSYVVSEGIFAWLLDNLAMIADWIFGIITMAPRMVFVGWAALIEKLLTWTLEQTAGINNQGGLVVDSTDITAINDSSGNLTVQAIVYNQVPLFDINFFKLEVDKTVSGTGEKLRCKSCGRTCEECCNITGSEPGSYDSTCKDLENGKKCECGNCSSCKSYLANWNAEEPMVIKIRQAITLWYSVIRLLSMAIMLIILIVVGLKMAISTIASDKALYKRMLVDWLVGIIILLSIHYIMIFVININETLVNTIKETANSINKTQLKFVTSGEKGEEEGSRDVTDEDIEISIYEEVRTRAYEPQLSVGLIGLIMYLTLIYFAIRYSIVYLKRYLTIIVLALMGPAVGVAYALQKVLSGKSSTLKKWLTEFIMNVIIQTVHALVYAMFVSTALALSLESIPGMVVALIFMNFTLKTEKMFREIFKMGESGSLLGSTAEAGSAEKMKQAYSSAIGLYTSAKPLTNALYNSPVSKLVKSTGKIALTGTAGAVYGIGKLGQKAGETKVAQKAKHLGSSAINGVSNVTGKVTGAIGNAKDRIWGSDGPGYIPPELSNETTNPQESQDQEKVKEQEGEVQQDATVNLEQEVKDGKLIKEGEDSLYKKAVSSATELKENPNAENKEELEQNIANYFRYKQIMSKGDVNAPVSTGTILKGHIANALDLKGHFNANSGYNGSNMASSLYRTVFGTHHYDKKTGKMVYDGNGYFSQFKPANLLGLSQEDIKDIKAEGLAPFRAIGGAASMLVGLSTITSHPALGGAALTGGYYVHKKNAKLPYGKKKYKGKYVNARFSASTVQTAQKNVINLAEKAITSMNEAIDRSTISRIRDEHPDFYKKILDELDTDQRNVKLSTTPKGSKLTRITKGVFGTITGITGIYDMAAYDAGRERITKGTLNQRKKELEEVTDQWTDITQTAHKVEWNNILKDHERQQLLPENQKKLFAQELLKTGEGGILTDVERKQELEKNKKQLERLGYSVDNSGKLSRTTQLKDEDLNFKNIETSEKQSDEKTKEIRQKVSSQIEKVIDDVLFDMYKVSDAKQLDFTDNKVLETAVKAVSLKMSNVQNIKNRDFKNVFSNGEETLKGILQKKSEIFNNQMNAVNSSSAEGEAKTKLQEVIDLQKAGFSEEEQQKIKDIAIAKVGRKGFTEKDFIDEFKKSSVIQAKTTTNRPPLTEDKKNAMKKFLKAFQEKQNPITAQDAVRASITEIPKGTKEKLEKETVKSSRKKLQDVLQFIEEQGDTISESVNATEAIIKGKKDGKIVIPQTEQHKQKEVELTDLESDTLDKLFQKMKEEIVFNEYTKNVLDKKDSIESKEAKKDMYEAHVSYLDSQLELLSKYQPYEATKDSIEKVLTGENSVEYTVDKIVNEIKDNSVDNALKMHANVLLEGIEGEEKTKSFSKMEKDSQRKVKNNLTDYLKKNLSYDVNSHRTKEINYENKKREAYIKGKIDVISQIQGLFED